MARLTGSSRPHFPLALVSILGLALVPLHASPVPAASHFHACFRDAAGNTSNASDAFSTIVTLTYSAGLSGTTPGTGATTSLYLYGANGNPLLSATGAVVCAPCVFESGSGTSAPRRRVIRIGDLVAARGGYGPGLQNRSGFIALDATGDTDRLSAAIESRVALPPPIDTLKSPKISRNILKGYLGPAGVAKTYVLENTGGPSEWDQHDWAVLSATYAGGIGPVPTGGGATVELYLFDESGAPRGGLAAPVCAPCTYALGTGGTSGAPRLSEIRLPAADSPTSGGFGIVRVSGASPEAVVLEQTDMDSIPGTTPMVIARLSRQLEALDLPAGALAVAEPDLPGAALMLRGSPNPASDGMTLAFDLAQAAVADVEVFDAAGRRVATVASGMRVAGHHELRWNRKDDAGHPLAAGIYYGRLRASDGSRVTKLVLLAP